MTGRLTLPRALVLLGLLFAAPPSAHGADADEIPDPRVTPGEVVSTERAVACAQGHTRRPRIEDADRRVLELYGVPWSERAAVEIDHLVPRCLGGADTVRNLWPQPLEEAVRKDGKERAICHVVCDLGTLPISDGQRFFIEGKWRAPPGRP